MGIADNKQKWWHGTLSIKNRDTDSVVTSLTTINNSLPDTNANTDTISAYSTAGNSCDTPINIPVPSFDVSLSPGYFLFRPTIEDLGNSIIDITTYQESVNVNKRYNFEFTLNSAYDSNDIDCIATVPNSIDLSPFQTITNNLNSNIFRYPEMPSYTQIGCCQIELSIPSSDIPALEIDARPTRIWFLTYDSSNSTYSLYSYDFALLSNALVFKGNIVVPAYINKIFDITWMPKDNSIEDSLIALCDSGIYRLFPGDATHNAIFGDNITVPGPIGSFIFPILQNEIDTFSCKIEYNYYDNYIYIFVPFYGSETVRSIICKLLYGVGVLSPVHYSDIYQMDTGDKAIGGFVFSQDSSPLVIFKGNLCFLDGLSTSTVNITRVTTEDPPANLLSGMNTLCFANHPDINVTENRIYSTNGAGQIFSVDPITGSAINLSILLPSSPIGNATTINGEDSRIQPFPFIIGQPHWLFMIDISSSMSGNRLPLIKSALINMLQTYVRYGDKITVLWFGGIYGKITKELRTYSDVNEVITYINTFLITNSAGNTNFCNAFSNISQNFSDLKNIFILSDGTFDDCGDSTSVWQQNLQNSINSIVSANAGVFFTCVSVQVSSGTEKLKYIASMSNGIYFSWN